MKDLRLQLLIGAVGLGVAKRFKAGSMGLTDREWEPSKNSIFTTPRLRHEYYKVTNPSDILDMMNSLSVYTNPNHPGEGICNLSRYWITLVHQDGQRISSVRPNEAFILVVRKNISEETFNSAHMGFGVLSQSYDLVLVFPKRKSFCRLPKPDEISGYFDVENLKFLVDARLAPYVQDYPQFLIPGAAIAGGRAKREMLDAGIIEQVNMKNTLYYSMTSPSNSDYDPLIGEQEDSWGSMNNPDQDFKVIRVETTKSRPGGHQHMRDLARGRMFDPNKVVSATVSIEGNDRNSLMQHAFVSDLLRVEASKLSLWGKMFRFMNVYPSRTTKDKWVAKWTIG